MPKYAVKIVGYVDKLDATDKLDAIQKAKDIAVWCSSFHAMEIGVDCDEYGRRDFGMGCQKSSKV